MSVNPAPLLLDIPIARVMCPRLRPCAAVAGTTRRTARTHRIAYGALLAPRRCARWSPTRRRSCRAAPCRSRRRVAARCWTARRASRGLGGHGQRDEGDRHIEEEHGAPPPAEQAGVAQDAAQEQPDGR